MQNELEALTVVFTEFYYWVTIVLMFLIHVGFCLYEVGVARYNNRMHTLMKNAMFSVPPRSTPIRNRIFPRSGLSPRYDRRSPFPEWRTHVLSLLQVW